MQKNIDDMEFEEALAELEKLSAQMNAGNLSLKESAGLYERGVLLKKHCTKILEAVEMKVNQISVDSSGTVSVNEKKSESEISEIPF